MTNQPTFRETAGGYHVAADAARVSLRTGTIEFCLTVGEAADLAASIKRAVAHAKQCRPRRR